MFLVVFVPDVLVELLKQDLRTLLGTCSTIIPCCDVLLNYFKSCTAQDKSISSAGWISSGTVFLVFCCHFFFKPSSTTTTTTNHYSPIMIKTMSNLTTSHEIPVKSTPSKLVIKNQHLHIGDEQIQTCLGGKPLNQSSPASVSTATTALSILSSQSTATIFTSSTQFNSSNLVRALDFANLPDQHTKKEPYLIDFCNPVDVKSKCLKYLSDARDIPLGQESQLTFLLNNLKLKDIQTAFIKLITIVGGAATTAFISMP
jgi:hypothetical protein